jgi:hypothetical protein
MNPPLLDTLPVAFEGSLDIFIPTLASQGKTDPTKNGFGVSIGTLRTEYPRKQASSQDNGFCLPVGGSSKATMCPRGSGSRSRLRVAPGPPRAPWLRAAPEPPHAPAARGSSGATTCHFSASTHILAQSSSRAAMRHLGSTGCKQINKYPLATWPS